MYEIRIPELISVVFLLLSLLRPLIKGFWTLDGLIWLPFLSLTITIGIFPAYGLRPECIPLLVFALILNILNIPALAAGIASRPNDDYRDRNLFFTVPALVLLAAVSFTALYFSPVLDPAPAAEGLRTVTVRDEAKGREYYLRIYHPAETAPAEPAVPRPLIFLVPPVFGSVQAVDKVGGGLRDRGFAVISYSRRGFDAPAVGEGGRKYFISPPKYLALWRASRSGAKTAAANNLGRALEEGRGEDIAFLLPFISGNRSPEGETLAPEADPRSLFLAGFDAGGAVLLHLAGTAGFGARYPGVRGIITVECRLWSGYRAEPRDPPVPEGSWFSRTLGAIKNQAAALRPLKIAGTGPVPRPVLPVLNLVSDRVQEPGDPRYAPLRETMRNSLYPMALLSLEGAGPLDYTDYPATHPLYSALFPGRKARNFGAAEAIEKTVTVMTNFAALLLTGRQAGLPEPPADAPLLRRGVDAEFQLETQSWNLGSFQDILGS
ncbi:MAG: hypothetical protein LBQ55_08230 [Treponema sp.]|jgi:hypothetical protein|nr:hypothetical protein [Treponema sp.]